MLLIEVDECRFDLVVERIGGVQLLVGDRCLGVLLVARPVIQPFTPDDMTFFSAFATQASMAVDNALLYERLKDVILLSEGQRLAREMHDGLAQPLGHLYMSIGKLQLHPCTEPLQEDLRLLKQVAAAAYDEVRQMIFGLTVRVSRSLGLIPTLTEYLYEFGQQSGIAFDLHVPDMWAGRLSAYVEVQLIRIVREALTNVRKHAHAKHVWVTLDTEQGQAKLTVCDDGRGFDPAAVMRLQRSCIGLQSMQERAAMAGGKFQIESQQGHGTQVIVWLPLEVQEAA